MRSGCASFVPKAMPPEEPSPPPPTRDSVRIARHFGKNDIFRHNAFAEFGTKVMRVDGTRFAALLRKFRNPRIAFDFVGSHLRHASGGCVPESGCGLVP